MNVNFIKIVSILILLPFFASCNDDELEVIFPVELTQHGMTFEKIRLFTNQGEVFDSKIIDNFIAEHKNFFLFEEITSTDSKMTFTSKDSVSFDDKKSCYVTKVKDLFLIYSNELVFTPISNKFELEDFITYVDPKKVVYSNNEYMYANKEIKVAKGDYHNLGLCGLNYKYVSNNLPNSLYGYCGADLNNEFNIECVSKLGKNDTLAIQEFVKYYKK